MVLVAIDIIIIASWITAVEEWNSNTFDLFAQWKALKEKSP